MIFVTLVCIFFMLFVGFLYPCLALFGHNVYAKKNKTLSTIIRWRKREHDIWESRSLNNILQILAPLIPLSAEAEKKLNDALRRADIPFTAKEYYAKAILSSMAGILIAVFSAQLKSYLLVIGGLLMTVYLFFHNYDQVKDTLKSKFSLIEKEIPTFIRSIVSELHTDHDIIHAIDRYSKIAKPAMKSELEILLADMQASNVPQALMRFDNRMHSPEVSRLCQALIEWDRGIDSSQTLSYLATDMTTMNRELNRRELDKRPGKMKRAILPAGVILVIMMFYMLIQAVMQSASTLI